MAGGLASSGVPDDGTWSVDDDSELAAFFRNGDQGTYKGGPSDSIAPVSSSSLYQLPFVDEEEPGEEYFARLEEQEDRRERYRRRVAQLVGGLAVGVVALCAVRLASSGSSDAAPAAPPAAAVTVATVAPAPVESVVAPRPEAPAEPSPLVLDEMALNGGEDEAEPKPALGAAVAPAPSAPVAATAAPALVAPPAPKPTPAAARPTPPVRSDAILTNGIPGQLALPNQAAFPPLTGGAPAPAPHGAPVVQAGASRAAATSKPAPKKPAAEPPKPASGLASLRGLQMVSGPATETFPNPK